MCVARIMALLVIAALPREGHSMSFLLRALFFFHPVDAFGAALDLYVLFAVKAPPIVPVFVGGFCKLPLPLLRASKSRRLRCWLNVRAAAVVAVDGRSGDSCCFFRKICWDV